MVGALYVCENVCEIDELPQGELAFTTLHVHAAACDHL